MIINNRSFVFKYIPASPALPTNQTEQAVIVQKQDTEKIVMRNMECCDVQIIMEEEIAQGWHSTQVELSTIKKQCV